MSVTKPDSAELVIVGTGIQAPRHASQRAVAEIRAADVVFALADALALSWIGQLNGTVENLAVHYRPNLDRRESYRSMQEQILGRLRTGKRVCVALYGHPGVFAQVGRRALQQARQEGYPARMEPGISAADCLYADLDFDPGERGLQSIEATQFLVEHRPIDPTSLVLIWQVAHTGKLDCTGFEPDRNYLALLSSKLQRWYKPSQEIILYEAPSLPIESPRVERLPLADLASAMINELTTLVIPPACPAIPDDAVLKELRAVDDPRS